MPQRQRFRPYDQPTLTLVQMRQQHRPIAESHDLIPGKP